MKTTPPSLTEVAEMSSAKLQKLWCEMSDEGVPSPPVSVLRQLVAHQIQEKRFGGLKTSVRRELENLARDARIGPAGSARPKAPSLSAGTRLVREWNGKTILVDVLDGSFRYNDRRWNSLSEIARHVTGSQWSGPRFFGLHKHG